jgi:cytochrome c biogenesis protein CcdA
MGLASSWWYIVLGVIMVLMALQVWGIFELHSLKLSYIKKYKKRICRCVCRRILGGVFSSPCSTPVLIALLAIVAGKGSVLWGILLLLLYSVGHSILAVVAGTSVGFVQKLALNKKYGKAGFIIKVVMGLLILLIGFYMFYLGF